MTEIMPVPRNLILLSYQQRAFSRSLFAILNSQLTFSAISAKPFIIDEAVTLPREMSS